MKIAVLKERRAHERRVAATPDTVKKFKTLGAEIVIESEAGLNSSFADADYQAAGATIAPDAASTLAGADIVLKVQRPLRAKDVQSGDGDIDEVALLPKGALVAAILSPYGAPDALTDYAAQGITAFAMDFMPRITRAQSMDVLSSQSNLAGYRAVIDAAAQFNRAFPMMMTAAGTVPPARAFVMGVGVAGLQAIATAKRLGAIVSATDVRLATKEQVQSLGANFVAVENEESRQAETAGGYAKEMSDEYKKLQAQLVADTLKTQDIVITTALIPGRPAPKLISADMVQLMKPGSVIYDLAGEAGGNCELTRVGETVEAHGVTIVAPYNIPSRVAGNASALYAKNLLNFFELMIKDKAIAIDWDDEIIKGTLLTRDGGIVHPNFASQAA